MFGFGKKEKNENGEETKKKNVSSFDGLKSVAGEVFKKRDIKFEKRKLNEEDKKAILYTALVMFGIFFLLIALPFTRQFIIDFFTLKF